MSATQRCPWCRGSGWLRDFSGPNATTNMWIVTLHDCERCLGSGAVAVVDNRKISKTSKLSAAEKPGDTPLKATGGW